MQFSAIVNRFIVKTKLNSTFINDLKKKKKNRKISKVTDYAALNVTKICYTLVVFIHILIHGVHHYHDIITLTVQASKASVLLIVGESDLFPFAVSISTVD